MSERQDAQRSDEEIGGTDVTREENVRSATHWGTPPDPEAVQQTEEVSEEK